MFSYYPSSFKLAFAHHFEGTQGAQLYHLINASRDDTKEISKGAQFALEHLKNTLRLLPKANFHEKIQFWLNTAQRL